MKKELLCSQSHSKPIPQVLKELDTDKIGLTKNQVEERKQKFGLNELPEKKPTSRIIVFLRQLKSMMIYILLVVAILSLLLKHMMDVYIILIVIGINTTIGFIQESKAEKAIKALKNMIILKAKVFRNSELIQIPAKEIIPGDIIQLQEGDKIPADARLIEIKNFRTVESSLTGESLPIDKTLDALPEKTPLADQANKVWFGTFVASGAAIAVVTATGQYTAIGKLAKSIEEIKPKTSHFKQKTDILAKHMAIIAIIGAVTIFLFGFFLRKLEFSKIFLFTLAALVSGIPEGLPAMLAIVLAIGSFRMAKRNAIIRNRFATESLAVVDTIITDKTGTLTENTLTIQKIILPGQKEISVSGAGWEPIGSFFQNKNKIHPSQNQHLSKLLSISAICNNSKLLKRENHEDHYSILGDPTEAALIVLAEKAGLKKPDLYHKEKKLDDLPFNIELKYRASLSESYEHRSQKEIYVVGAPEAILQNSAYVLKNGRKIRFADKEILFLSNQIDSLTNNAMRVLALAYKPAPDELEELSHSHINNLVLVGLVGMIDPPRAEVKEAIQKAKGSGIRIIMATGDHKNTAIAIAKKINLTNEKNPSALTESDLAKLSKKQFEDAVMKTAIFARLTPTTKLKIARTLQKKGHIIAMTGDGVNDAPALRQADIGIAMGQIGTDVARESSEMILADDNFASIINAIEEGRIVFTNTRQTSFFLVTTNFAEVITILSSLFLWLPLPLLPTQLLWLNLVTDGVASGALATEKNHHDTLNEKPMNKNENILNLSVIPLLLVMSILMTGLTLAFFRLHLLTSLDKARTAAFAAMAFTQVFNMFNTRSLKKSVFKIGVFSNKFINIALVASLALSLIAIYTPFIQTAFQFAPLTILQLLVIFAVSSLVLWFGEAYKFLRYRN